MKSSEVHAASTSPVASRHKRHGNYLPVVSRAVPGLLRAYRSAQQTPGERFIVRRFQQAMRKTEDRINFHALSASPRRGRDLSGDDRAAIATKRNMMMKRTRSSRSLVRTPEGNSQLNSQQPLKRFRRIAVCVRIIAAICKTVSRYASHSPMQWSFLEMKLKVEDEFQDMLAFNPTAFRGNKKNAPKCGERLRKILSIPPSERTEGHIQTILALLKHNTHFQEYPTSTQVLLSKCMVYQRYESRRLVLKEGHRAYCFYVIISGTVLINMKEETSGGQSFIRTVHELSEGEAFGELALINDSRRTCNVVTKTDVELLAVGKEDFDKIIKEPLTQQREKHVEFLRSLELFKHFPVAKLQAAQSQFFYQYFPKEKVIVQNSNDSEYLVIVKSGTCKIVSELGAPPGQSELQRKQQQELRNIFPLVDDSRKRNRSQKRNKCAQALEWEIGEIRDTMKANILMGVTDPERIMQIQGHQKEESLHKWIFKRKKLSQIYQKVEQQRISQTVAPALGSIKEDRVRTENVRTYANDRFARKEEVKAAVEAEHQQRLKGMSRTIKRVAMAAKQEQEEDDMTVPAAGSRESFLEMLDAESSRGSFAQIAILVSGSVFGLESLFHKSPTKLTLVSDGAECVMLSKKLFLRECNAQVLRVVSEVIIRYPNATYVKQQLRQSKDWDAFKKDQLNAAISKKKTQTIR